MDVYFRDCMGDMVMRKFSVMYRWHIRRACVSVLVLTILVGIAFNTLSCFRQIIADEKARFAKANIDNGCQIYLPQRKGVSK